MNLPYLQIHQSLLPFLSDDKVSTPQIELIQLFYRPSVNTVDHEEHGF